MLQYCTWRAGNQILIAHAGSCVLVLVESPQKFFCRRATAKPTARSQLNEILAHTYKRFERARYVPLNFAALSSQSTAKSAVVAKPGPGR